MGLFFCISSIKAQNTNAPKKTEKTVKSFNQNRVFKNQGKKLTKAERLKIYQTILADPKASEAKKAKATISIQRLNNN